MWQSELRSQLLEEFAYRTSQRSKRLEEVGSVPQNQLAILKGRIIDLCKHIEQYWLAYIEMQEESWAPLFGRQQSLEIVMYDNESEELRTGPDWNLFTCTLTATRVEDQGWTSKNELEFTFVRTLSIKDIEEEMSKIETCKTFIQFGFLAIVFEKIYIDPPSYGLRNRMSVLTDTLRLCLNDDITVDGLVDRILKKMSER